jgi:DNA-binding transcriptional ArsR family regulator
VVEYRSASLDHIFGAVADPTRRAILQRLGRGPARVTDIAKSFPVSLNAVSKHLMVLEHAGLIRRDVQGRDHVCELDARPLRRASTWLDEVQAFWEVRLDNLERHVLAKRRKKQ